MKGAKHRNGNCGRMQSADVTAYAANSLNQYSVITNSAFSASPREISPTYDLNGNMTWDGTNAYFWDLQNQLVLVSNAEVQVASAYDAMGRRVKKIVSRRDAETQSWEVESTRHFFYDGWNVIRETIHSTLPSFQSSTNLYTWGNDLSGSLQGAGGVGGLLAVLSSGSQPYSLTAYYPLFDHNGNVERYVSRSGATVAAFQYDAFGNTVAQSGEMADVFAYRFSTKYWDAETGLYYYGYRFYSPRLGRWINRDPIGECDSVGLYGYTQNVPVNLSDYLGLSGQKVSCKCDENEINMFAYTLTTIAQRRSHDNRRKYGNEFYYMEYCGIICCDEETGAVSTKGPIEGDYRFNGKKDGPYSEDTYLKVPYVYFNGKKISHDAKTCGDAFTKLSCDGKKAIIVRHVHVHPPDGGSSFSQGDASWQPITLMEVTENLSDSTAIYMLFNNTVYKLDMYGNAAQTDYRVRQQLPIK